MKAKLTLTVEEALIPKAKRNAGEKGVSLSEVVEGALRLLTDPQSGTPFSAKWRGRFKLSRRVSSRFRRLAARYGV